jgi:NADH-quinone oxidoreductase subunit N
VQHLSFCLFLLAKNQSIAVLTSAVGVYYYFKVIIAMYFKPAKDDSAFTLDSSIIKIVLVVTTIITLVIGFMPGYVIDVL